LSIGQTAVFCMENSSSARCRASRRAKCLS
jgi:hypothetical protein